MSLSGQLRSGSIVVDVVGIALSEVQPTDERLGTWSAIAAVTQTVKARQAAAALMLSDDDSFLELADGRVGRCNCSYDGIEVFHLDGAERLQHPSRR